MREARSDAAYLGGGDVTVVLLLVGVALVFLTRWPLDLNTYDEGVLLYGAKRILDGDVPYRDFFEIVTPVVFYLVAGLYGLFGTSLEVVRGANVALHVTIVALTYVLARRLGAGRATAAVAGVAHVVVCFPAFAQATPHWVSTALVLGITLLLCGEWWRAAPWRAVVPGSLVGLLVMVQQQKGVPTAVGGVGVILLLGALARRRGSPLDSPVRRLVWYLAGALVVAGGALAALVARAGVEPVFGALVRHPLTNYRQYHLAVTWGWVTDFPLVDPFGRLLVWMPLVLPLTVLLAWDDARAGRDRETQRLGTFLVMALSAIWSIWYSPNYTHKAMIAPLFFAATAAVLDRGARRFLPRAGVVIALGVALLVAGRLAVQAREVLATKPGLFPAVVETPFGRVATTASGKAATQALIQLFRDADPADRETFVHPMYPGLYLTTGTRNTTRFQLLIPGYSTPAQFDEVIARLEARQPRYVIVDWLLWPPRADPFMRWLSTRYRPLPRTWGWFPRVYERKDPAPASR